MRYGGNTACIEVRIGALVVIIDCGTGMRELGNSLMQEFRDRPIEGHIFVGHTHWDHIQGLPFFAPLYAAHNQFHFHSFRLPRASVEEALQGQMADPYFPVDMNAMLAAPGVIGLLGNGHLKISWWAVGAAGPGRACHIAGKYGPARRRVGAPPGGEPRVAPVRRVTWKNIFRRTRAPGQR